MLDDNPGMREQLSAMREQTLGARGKFVGEADAAAVRYYGGPSGGPQGQQAQDEELPPTPQLRGKWVEGMDSAHLLPRGGAGLYKMHK